MRNPNMQRTAMKRPFRRMRRRIKRAGDAVVGALAIGVLKPSAWSIRQDGGFRRVDDAHASAPCCRNIRIGRANLVAAFPEKSPPRSTTILRGVWDNLGRMGAEFAHLDRLWNYDPEHPTRAAASNSRNQTSSASSSCATTASRR